MDADDDTGNNRMTVDVSFCPAVNIAVNIAVNVVVKTFINGHRGGDLTNDGGVRDPASVNSHVDDFRFQNVDVK